jgi:hypothetical protein
MPQCAFKVSMLNVSAIHISSRIWLRSSSTHEPSDPPLRIVRFCNPSRGSFKIVNRFKASALLESAIFNPSPTHGHCIPPSDYTCVSYFQVSRIELAKRTSHSRTRPADRNRQVLDLPVRETLMITLYSHSPQFHDQRHKVDGRNPLPEHVQAFLS